MRLLALSMLGLGAICWAPWIIARLGRRYGAPDDVPIAKPRYVYLNADEGLRERTAKKRQAADAIRNRAAKVESGAPVADLLRVVRK